LHKALSLPGAAPAARFARGAFQQKTAGGHVVLLKAAASWRCPAGRACELRLREKIQKSSADYLFPSACACTPLLWRLGRHARLRLNKTACISPCAAWTAEKRLLIQHNGGGFCCQCVCGGIFRNFKIFLSFPHS
jgi:hypothetical protein